MSKSIEDMMIISFRGLGNSIRGKILCQIACLTILWIMWQERTARIFKKWRIEETLWDLLHFYSSLWPLVPLLLGEFHLMLFNWVGFRFLIQKEWVTLRGVDFSLQVILYMPTCLVILIWWRSLLLLWSGLNFVSRISHPSLFVLLIKIHLCFWYKK